MGQPAARQGDKVVGVDIHIVLVPSPGGPVPTPLPHPFSGTITSATSTDVKIMGMPAATQGSKITNSPPHIFIPPGTSFQKPPTNQGTVQMGSQTVKINGKPAARVGDSCMTCNDPVDAVTTAIVPPGGVTVLIG